MKQHIVDVLAEAKESSQRLIRLFLPVLIEQFFITIMAVINTMLASRLGPSAISAIGTDGTIINVAISVFSALSIGGTVVVAQYTGRGEHHKANQATALALSATTIISVVITTLVFIFRRNIIMGLFGEAEADVLTYAVQYLSIVVFYFIPVAITTMGFGILRGAGDVKTPMLISTFMNVLNVLLGWILIYGYDIPFLWTRLQFDGFGVRGAAIALLSAQTIGMSLVLFVLFRGNRNIKLRDKTLFRFDGSMLKRIFGLGVPAGAEQLMFNGGKLLVQTFIMALGTTAIAANAVVNSATMLILAPGSALSIIATTLVGQTYGSGNKEQTKKMLKFIFAASVVLLLLSTLIFLPLRRPLLSLYTSDTATLEAAIPLFTTYLIVMPLFWAPSFVIPAGLRGAGDVRFTMIISIISMWLFRILFSYIFAIVFNWGVIGIWLAMYLDWIGRGSMFVPRMLGNKWLQRRTID